MHFSLSPHSSHCLWPSLDSQCSRVMELLGELTQLLQMKHREQDLYTEWPENSRSSALAVLGPFSLLGKWCCHVPEEGKENEGGQLWLERVLSRVINKQQMRKREPEKCRGADSTWGLFLGTPPLHS